MIVSCSTIVGLFVSNDIVLVERSPAHKPGFSCNTFPSTVQFSGQEGHYRTTGADHIPSSDYCSTALRALLQAAYNVYTQYCNSPSIARDEKEVNDL